MGFEDKVIVVDLDGTVCTIEEDYSRCQPMPGSIDALRTIRQKGYKVYIYTGRHINHFELTTRWLERNGVEYDHIVFGKPPAKYYVDDKGIQFTTWSKTLEKLGL